MPIADSSTVFISTFHSFIYFLLYLQTCHWLFLLHGKNMEVSLQRSALTLLWEVSVKTVSINEIKQEFFGLRKQSCQCHGVGLGAATPLCFVVSGLKKGGVVLICCFNMDYRDIFGCSVFIFLFFHIFSFFWFV